MPLIFVGLIFWANPEIYGGAARDPLFFPVLLAAGGLQVVGILVMRRMARIRV
jgi:Flp pilus assembly protein TadB